MNLEVEEVPKIKKSLKIIENKDLKEKLSEYDINLQNLINF